jgi:CBS domain-containing protein
MVRMSANIFPPFSNLLGCVATVLSRTAVTDGAPGDFPPSIRHRPVAIAGNGTLPGAASPAPMPTPRSGEANSSAASAFWNFYRHLAFQCASWARNVMKIVDVMSRGVEPISPQATVQQAAIRMAEQDVGALLVGSEAAVEGIVTDRDILLRVVVEGLDAARVQVRNVMSSTLFTCRTDDPVQSAFQQMSDHQVRRLPVLNEQGELVGIVTLGDLTRREQDPSHALEALRGIAEPHRGHPRADPRPSAERPK